MSVEELDLLARIDAAIDQTKEEYKLSAGTEWQRNDGFVLQGLRQARRIIEKWIGERDTHH